MGDTLSRMRQVSKPGGYLWLEFCVSQSGGYCFHVARSIKLGSAGLVPRHTTDIAINFCITDAHTTQTGARLLKLLFGVDAAF
jgi:hypothetical protein